MGGVVCAYGGLADRLPLPPLTKRLPPHLASELGQLGAFERQRPILRTERAASCRRGGIELCASVCRAVYSAPSALPIVSTASKCVCASVVLAGLDQNARREKRCLGLLVSYRVLTVRRAGKRDFAASSHRSVKCAMHAKWMVTNGCVTVNKRFCLISVLNCRERGGLFIPKRRL